MNPTRKAAIGAFLLGSAVAGGIAVTTLGNASAAPGVTVTTTAGDGSGSSGTTSDGGDDGRAAGPHTANGVTEEELTGDTAAKAKAAVLAAHPGATIERLETDADGAKYEAHVTLADGSEATVKLDASFTVTATETGHDGHGGPGGHGPGDGGGPHTANGITEEELTGDTAAKVEAAVVATYPKATIDRLETDADGAKYEAHITQANGTRTTVKLDASFSITGTSDEG
jgi:uncharacterized membrane protein YkoI